VHSCLCPVGHASSMQIAHTTTVPASKARSQISSYYSALQEQHSKLVHTTPGHSTLLWRGPRKLEGRHAQRLTTHPLNRPVPQNTKHTFSADHLPNSRELDSVQGLTGVLTTSRPDLIQLTSMTLTPRSVAAEARRASRGRAVLPLCCLAQPQAAPGLCTHVPRRCGSTHVRAGLRRVVRPAPFTVADLTAALRPSPLSQRRSWLCMSSWRPLRRASSSSRPTRPGPGSDGGARDAGTGARARGRRGRRRRLAGWRSRRGATPD
jgi:hypothetical protein